MVSKYAIIKHIPREIIRKLQRVGEIKPTLLRNLEIFEEFEALNIKCILCRYEIVAENNGLSTDHIRKIVRDMKNS